MIFQVLINFWNWVINSGDARTNQFPFIKDPTVALCVAATYLLIVILGPKFMEKREALAIRKILIGYNFLSVLFSIWMMWEFFACSLLRPGFNLFCEELNEKDTSATTMRLLNAHWWYFFSKSIEFLDTFFFILRKKNNQISFLHVYHHVTMLGLHWGVLKYIPGGVFCFGPLLNCFIHSLMYTYYMLSAFGPHMQKYLWWKKYLTRMQMIQFFLVLLHTSYAIHCTTTYPKPLMWLQWCYLVTLFALFMNFYLKAYVKSKVKAKED